MKIYLSSLSDSNYYISKYITDKELENINDIIHYKKSGKQPEKIKQEVDEYLKLIGKSNIKTEYLESDTGYLDFLFYLG